MNFHDKESSLNSDKPNSTSLSEPILLEPPSAKPPVQVPKCNPDPPSLIPDFESVNFSVISDVSEFDSVVFPISGPNGVMENYSPLHNYNKMPYIPPLSYLNAKPTSNMHTGNNQLFRNVHQVASGAFGQSNSNYASPQGRMSNVISPNVYQYNNEPNYVVGKNCECCPYEMNSSFSSCHQKVCDSNINYKKVRAEPQRNANLINQSDSIALLPQQLQFHENSAAMNNCVNSDDIPQSLSKNGSNVVVQNQEGPRSAESNESFAQTNGLKSDCANEKGSVPGEIWSLVHEQNEKIKQLQNQLAEMQQQNRSVVASKQETAASLSEDRKFEMINESLKSILQYITEHNNTIMLLKDQVSILTKRTDGLESRSQNNVSESSNASPFLNIETPNKSYSRGDAMCRNETHVKKVSSSTMTSVTMDGNEKLLFSKTTVVTEDCQNDVLLHPTQAKNFPVQLNRAENCSGNGASCLECIAQGSSKSKPKSARKNERGHENVSPCADMILPSAVKLRASDHKSPLSDSNQANKIVKNGQSPRERNLPTYNSVVRNIDHLVLQDDEEKHCSCCYCKENNSPRTGPSSAKKKSKLPKNKETCGQLTTSEDSDYASPNSGGTEDDEYHDLTKKKYGIPSTLMSVDTQQYLEKHQLYDLQRRSSRKSNSSQLKKHFR